MSTIEDRLRDALTERARHSPVHPGAWEQTLARTRRRPRSGAWGRYVIPAAAAAAVVAIVTAATVLTGRGGLDGGHRSSGASRTATAQPALPAPLSQKDYLIKQDPPVREKRSKLIELLWLSPLFDRNPFDCDHFLQRHKFLLVPRRPDKPLYLMTRTQPKSL